MDRHVLLAFDIEGLHRIKQHYYNKIPSVLFYSLIWVRFISTYIYKNEK